MKNKILALLATAAITYSLPGKSADVPINIVMQDLAANLQQVYPLLYDEKLENDNKKQQQFSNSYKKITTAFKLAKPHLDKQTVTYSISYDVMEQFLQEIGLTLENNQYLLAQGMMRSLSSVCVTCHTQDHQHSKIFTNVKKEQFPTNFEFAEFNYQTRNYDQAIKEYEQFIYNIKDFKRNEDRINTSLQRLLVIYAQVDNSLVKGAQKLDKFLESPNLPQRTKLMINEWISALKEIDANYGVDNYSPDPESLKKLISEQIKKIQRIKFSYFASEKEKVHFIVLRGWLYEYLNTNPAKSEIPVLLYWLGQCDRILSYSFYYSLADLYLKECMINYHDHPYASKCYKAYKDFVDFEFTGSSGTHIPPDVAEELDVLHDIVQGKELEPNKVVHD